MVVDPLTQIEGGDIAKVGLAGNVVTTEVAVLEHNKPPVWDPLQV